MPIEVFLDTNVLIYAFDQSAPEKRQVATKLLQPGTNQFSVGVSWQVVQEFSSVALGRFKKSFTASDLAEYLEVVLFPLCQVWPSAALYRQALNMQARYSYAWHDSLIITSAISCGAKTLYSEDLHHGQKIGGLTILNPF